jgi:hypothetical protein
MQEERRAPHPMLVEMHGDLKVLKDRQETMYEELFGNGQPGELEKIRGRIASVDARVTEVHERTMQWKWLLVGGWAVASIIALIVWELVKA